MAVAISSEEELKGRHLGRGETICFGVGKVFAAWVSQHVLFFCVVEGGGKDNVHVNCRSSEDRTLEVRLQSKNPCLAEFTRAAAGMTELCCLMPRFYCVALCMITSLLGPLCVLVSAGLSC